MARAPQGGPEQRCCWQAFTSALASLPMTTLKKPAAKRKPAPTPPSEAEIAVYSLLFTAKPTREERRMAVRLLLRKASAWEGRSGD